MRKPLQPCRIALRTQTGEFLPRGQTWRDTLQLSCPIFTKTMVQWQGELDQAFKSVDLHTQMIRRAPGGASVRPSAYTNSA